MVKRSCVAALLLAGCIESGAPPEPTGPSAGPIAAPQVADEPPPISQAVELARAVPEQRPDPLRAFRGSLRRAGADRVLAVRARVDGVAAKQRRLPALVSFGDDANVATNLSLTILDTVCGAAPGARIDAWYAGGVLPDGTGFRTSEMMSDPPVGSEYVFWLERLDGDWFLTSSSFLLAPAASNSFRSRDGNSLSTAELKGVCP